MLNARSILSYDTKQMTFGIFLSMVIKMWLPVLNWGRPPPLTSISTVKTISHSDQYHLAVERWLNLIAFHLIIQQVSEDFFSLEQL